MVERVLLGLAAVILAPLAGALLAGVDRKITARVQSRIGPPVLQPILDVVKLLGKETRAATPWVGFCAWMYAIQAGLAVGLFFAGVDLLLVFFVQAAGAVFLVLGALSVPSPYSRTGAQRELLVLAAYEPLLLVALAGIAAVTGTFDPGAALNAPSPLLLDLPLVYLALTWALTVKLRKSPFDVSGSHHAHQELVRGVHTEYSGGHLALAEIAHFYEVILVLCFCALFWTTSWWGMALLLVLTYGAEILVDNVSARMTWHWMLATAWTAGLVLAGANFAWLALG